MDDDDCGDCDECNGCGDFGECNMCACCGTLDLICDWFCDCCCHYTSSPLSSTHTITLKRGNTDQQLPTISCSGGSNNIIQQKPNPNYIENPINNSNLQHAHQEERAITLEPQAQGLLTQQ